MGFVFSAEDDGESPTCVMHEGFSLTGPGSTGNMGSAEGVGAFDFSVQVKGPPSFVVPAGEEEVEMVFYSFLEVEQRLGRPGQNFAAK